MAGEPVGPRPYPPPGDGAGPPERDRWVLQVLGLPLPDDGDPPGWDPTEWDSRWSGLGLGRAVQASLWLTVEEVLRRECPEVADSWAMDQARFLWALSGNVFEATGALREALHAR